MGAHLRRSFQVFKRPSGQALVGAGVEDLEVGPAVQEGQVVVRREKATGKSRGDPSPSRAGKPTQSQVSVDRDRVGDQVGAGSQSG